MRNNRTERKSTKEIISEIQSLYRRAKEMVFSNPRTALEMAVQASALARREEQKREEGYALLVEGLAHFMLNAADDAYRAWITALGVFRAVRDAAGETECMSNLGNYCLSHSDFSTALQWYNDVLQSSRKLGNIYREASTLNNMGTASKALGEYPKAVEYHKQALALAEQKLDTERERIDVYIIALNNLAALYWELGAVVDAVEHFTRALHFVQQVGDTYREAGLFNNLGSVYEAMGNNARAIEYYEQGIALARQLGHERELLLPLINLGSVLRKQQKRDEAKHHLEEAFELARHSGCRTEEALALGNIGMVYEEWQQYDKAEKYLCQALTLYRELGAREGEMKVLSALGEIYVQQGNATRARTVLQQALDIAEPLTMKTRLFEIYKNLSAACKAVGDFAQALQYHEQYHNVEREVFNDEIDKRLQHLMVQLQIERTERERELYRNQAELLEREVEFKRQELTSHALHLVEREKLLRTTRRFLEQFRAIVPTEQVAELEKVLQMLKQSNNKASGWDVFDEKFRELHGNFLAKLSVLYAPLSPMEEKVCMLTKLHFATKEIAAVLHTGVRTVEAHRYRLRKKFNIGNEVNFATFLHSL